MFGEIKMFKGSITRQESLQRRITTFKRASAADVSFQKIWDYICYS